MMKALPIARIENIVTQTAGKETLIYDMGSNKVYCLNETLAKVYSACNGATTFQEVKEHYRFTDDIIYLSLDELKKEGLLKSDAEYISPLTKLSRREAVKRAALTTAIALPLITSLIAPKAINAASVAGPCSNISCTFDGTFTQGTCCSGLRCNDVNSCAACQASGTFLFDVFASESACTAAACSGDARRNYCCNSGSLVPEYQGASVCLCRCP